MDKFFVLKNGDFNTFLNKISLEYEVFFPVKKGRQRFFKKFKDSTAQAIVGEVRPFEPLKAFFSRAREWVAENFSGDAPPANHKPYAIVGVKACDLKGFLIQDFVFKNKDYNDPFYIRNRDKNLIIGSDCTCAIDVCFCLALGIQPYPERDFDLNLSTIPGGYIVQVGTNKGEALINQNASLFGEATAAHLKARDDQRTQTVLAVKDNINKYQIPTQDKFKGIIERNFNGKIWEEESRTCVECGACTNICPTCHCFFLYDQKDEKQMARMRVWDSCMIKDYARVAGGGNPRKKLWMRLRNRFEKKFDFFPKLNNVYACTGCGRCVIACPAKIDIRKVLRRLVNNA